MIKQASNIIITGFMGTGKTRVGKEVARRLNRDFFDTDEMIESQAKMSISEVFSIMGEARFRELEKRIARRLLANAEVAVISTGGGTLVSSENRNRFLNSGMVFCLFSRVETLKKRIGNSSSRPLLNHGRIEKNLKELLRERTKAYEKLPNQIDTSDLSPGEAADRIIQTYQRLAHGDHGSAINVRVEATSKSCPYTIHIRAGIIKEMGRALKKLPLSGGTFVLTNDKVHSLYYERVKDSLKKSGIIHKVIIIPDGERYKNIRTYNRVFDRLVELRADRQSTLVALGGGVIGDLGGFVAATYMRGIDLVHIPTTLLAQIDSSIGGKVAVDHKMAKNLIGSFYNPRLVLTDPEVLATLRRRDVLNGVFEAVKIALVSRKELFSFISDNLNGILRKEEDILRQLIIRCVKEKVRIIRKDPFEKNLRTILNFGHTFAHALETNRQYRSISHGEAVGSGMLLAVKLSNKLAHLSEPRTEEIAELVSRLVKPDKIRKANPEQIWETIALDKKGKSGKVRFVLLKDIGRPVVEQVSKRTFLKFLGEI